MARYIKLGVAILFVIGIAVGIVVFVSDKENTSNSSSNITESRVKKEKSESLTISEKILIQDAAVYRRSFNTLQQSYNSATTKEQRIKAKKEYLLYIYGICVNRVNSEVDRLYIHDEEFIEYFAQLQYFCKYYKDENKDINEVLDKNISYKLNQSKTIIVLQQLENRWNEMLNKQGITISDTLNLNNK